MLTTTPAHPDDVYPLAPSLCESDVLHLTAASEVDADGPLRGPLLEAVVSQAWQTFSIVDEDNVLHGIWGHDMKDPLMNWGEVFLLSSTDLFNNHLREITRVFRKSILPMLLESYDVLSCTVRSENKGLMRWLRGAGFTETYSNHLRGEQFSLMTIGLDTWHFPSDS